MIPKPDSALLIIAHGSSVNPDSSAPTHAHAEEIRRRGLFASVDCGFWKEEPNFRQVFNTIASRNIYVVPNFLSDGYFTRQVIPRELDLDGELTVRGARTIKYCRPVGDHPDLTRILLARARDAAPGVPPHETSLLIVGHGTPLNENSGAAVREQARQIAERGEYAEVFGLFIEEEPFVSDWRKLATKHNVVAVSFFIADGMHSGEDIPALIGIQSAPAKMAARMDLYHQVPYQCHGHTVYYAGAIGTEPQFADIIVDQVEAFDRRHVPKGAR